MAAVTYVDLYKYFLKRAKGCADNGHLQWLYSLMTVDVKVRLGSFIGTTLAYVTNIEEDGVVTITRDRWENINKQDNEAKLATQIQKLKNTKYSMNNIVNVTFIDKESNTVYKNRRLCWDFAPPKTMYVE
jgi:hypothetical protein